MTDHPTQDAVMGGGSAASRSPIELGPSAQWQAQKPDVINNIKSAMQRDLPEVDHRNLSDKPFYFVAGGPSLRQTWHFIPQLYEAIGRGFTMASNDAHEYLRENGVKFDACVISEIMPKELRLYDHIQKHVTYYVASQTHPSTFDRLLEGGANIRVWHMAQGDFNDEIAAILPRDREIKLFGGGTSGALKMLCGSQVFWKARDLRIFGLDSSFADQTHAYENRTIGNNEVECGGRTFKVNRFLIRQAQTGLEDICRRWQHDTKFEFYGDGLLPHMVRMARRVAEDRADSISPPPSAA